jgi:hypothetical protein
MKDDLTDKRGSKKPYRIVYVTGAIFFIYIFSFPLVQILLGLEYLDPEGLVGVIAQYVYLPLLTLQQSSPAVDSFFQWVGSFYINIFFPELKMGQ